ncbi:hypothetical protein SASPL_155376 [Salvia splendens]|uniref:Cytochrome b561 domain-containing protein n=1 Tax=Salvia splendens TaxID=180675 RepID=A0A8X8Z048_SALSN|nr:hypothetical protein SASPL_155376 [Salvia splendens]
MRGSQAMAAFAGAGGGMTVKAFNVSDYALAAPTDDLWFAVNERAAEFGGGVMTLFARLLLPETGITVVNHAWQVGSEVEGETPLEHSSDPDNLMAKGRLDLVRGTAASAGAAGANGKSRKRNLGISVSQSGVVLPPCFWPSFGLCRWGTGLKLGGESKGITHDFHRNIGITLFALATLQMFALVLRPKKGHKYRPYWNIYHHVIGYALGITNVFKGFDILKPQEMWRTT